MAQDPARSRSIVTVLLAALGWAVLGALVLPLAVYTGMQGFNALSGACSRGPAGDCDMAAAVYGALAVIPGALLGAATGIVRALRRNRAP